MEKRLPDDILSSTPMRCCPEGRHKITNLAELSTALCHSSSGLIPGVSRKITSPYHPSASILSGVTLPLSSISAELAA